MRTLSIFTSLNSSATCILAALLMSCLLSFQHADAANIPSTSTAKRSAPKITKPGKKKTAPAKASKVIKGKAFGKSSAVKALAQELAHQQQLPLAWVQQQLAQARLLPQVLQLVLPPASVQQKNWNAYRARFLSECRIQAGTQFWREHTLALDQAHLLYGVEPRFIIGILGVETYFGQHKGQYRLLDALTTLSLNFPSSHPQAQERQAFFQKELGFFLKQQRAQPSRTPVLGSYAGASGWPQFMPSSIAKFAVDFDGDGRIDLINNSNDAIGSVANYFKAFGWHVGMPTHFEVNVQAANESDMAALLAPDIVPSWSVAHMEDKQLVLSAAGKSFDQPLALVQLHNGGDTPTYIAGTDNFFVITRYNRSSYYALAVIELGLAVENAMALADNTKAACP
jgi:membrane-bound lytic murein transglycosylase B